MSISKNNNSTSVSFISHLRGMITYIELAGKQSQGWRFLLRFLNVKHPLPTGIEEGKTEKRDK